MKISIVVTFYNIEKYIRECMESILGQEEIDFELICVDDASTDNSFELLIEYEQKDKRIKVIRNKENIGQASSRNKGIQIAKGKYLYIMDGDDYLKKNALSTMYSIAEDNQLDVLTFSGEAFPDNENMKRFFERYRAPYIRKGIYDGIMTGPEMFCKFITNGDTNGNLCLQFVNRKFYVENNLFSENSGRYSEDSPFSTYMKAKRVMCITDILYMRRYREDSITVGKKRSYHFESVVIMFLRELQIWQETYLKENLNLILEEYFINKKKAIDKIYRSLDESEKKNVKFNNYPMASYFYKYFFLNMPIYCRNLTQDKLEQIKQYKKVIIYGIGENGIETKKVLDINGIDNYVFAVTDNKVENKIEDIYVYNIEELIKEKEEAIVLITVIKRNQKIVQENLERLEFKNWIIVE